MHSVSSIHASTTHNATSPSLLSSLTSWRTYNHPSGYSSHKSSSHQVYTTDVRSLGLEQSLKLLLFFPHVVCINVKTFQMWYFLATTSWNILRDSVSTCCLKFWPSVTLLITGEPGFVPFLLLSWFVALSKSPTSSCARSLLRHELKIFTSYRPMCQLNKYFQWWK